MRSDDGTRGVSVPVHSFDLERDAYPYPDGSFDVVVCCEILEHLLVDPMHMMVEIHRVLKPGGHLLLTTPNATCTHSVQAALEGKSPHVYGHYEVGGEPTDRHNREYTPGEVRALLENSGMQVHRLETVESWWRTDREILEFLGENTAEHNS